jgi:hypothetical protein
MSDQELVDLRSYRTLDEATDEELIELAPHETSLDFFRKIYHSVK